MQAENHSLQQVTQGVDEWERTLRLHSWSLSDGINNFDTGRDDDNEQTADNCLSVEFDSTPREQSDLSCHDNTIFHHDDNSF
jgi:hypothetical protein